MKPDKTRIVGKVKDNERIQECRPSQIGRKRIVELDIESCNSFFHYCETLGTTPLQAIQQNNNETWINSNQSDGESHISRIKHDNCPTSALKNVRKHETVILIRLQQTAKNQHSQSGTKREDDRGHKESREGLLTGLTITGRRNRPEYKNLKRNSSY